MGKLENIDLSKSNVDKYIGILKAGVPVYRIIIGPYDPKIPTGQENRCAKNPRNVDPQQYQALFADSQFATCGTGNVFCSFALETASRELEKRYDADKLQFAVAHEIKFKKDIPFIDTVSLCLSAGVDPTPGEDHSFWHSFYGPPIHAQALRCRSAQDPAGENIIIF